MIRIREFNDQEYNDLMECLRGYADVVTNHNFIERVQKLVDRLDADDAKMDVKHDSD